MSDLVRMLGKKRTQEEIQSFLLRVGGNQDWSTDEDAVFCSMRDKGLELMFDRSEVLHAIFLLSEGEDGADEYREEIPGGLVFSYSQQDVRTKLGSPSSASEAKRFLNETISPWDKYNCGSYTIHIEYSRSK